MATELKVPSLGMDMEEANIVRWLVEEGAEVEKGEPILEIDTDKTSFEIESPATGIVRGIQGAEGATVPVGATLAFIAAPGEQAPASGADGRAKADEPPAQQQTRPDAQSSPAPDTQADTQADAQAPQPNGDRRRLRASPAARRAAEERGLRLEDVAGSGPGGRVYLSDVLEADVRQDAPATVAPAPESVSPTPAIADGSRREPLSRIRRLGAERTAKSFREVPHFYLTRDLDVERLLDLRERLKERMDPAPSVTDLLALAIARTLKTHPRLNGRYVEGELEVRESVNLGIAVATGNGLVVPVLKSADTLPLKELVPAAKGLVTRARDGRLAPEELSGGTFTVSNLGMMEIDSFDAIINAPEAAILAVGRVRTVPEWRGGDWLPRRVMSGTLSVDHRVADGADGARFLMDLQAALTDWELLL